MAMKTMLNNVGASTQPCLKPFVTGKGSEYSPSASPDGRLCQKLLSNQQRLCTDLGSALDTFPGVFVLRKSYQQFHGPYDNHSVTLVAAGVDTLGAVVADLHTGGPGRPERRTALVARELARYNIDIAALSETRFANERQLTEYGGGYTFFWSGRSADERRESGVDFAIRNHLVQKLANLPKGKNDRLMSMQIHLHDGKRATLISAYAPTMTNPEDVKGRFYEDLNTMLSSVRSTDKLILLGDFNARVGRDSSWDGVIGKSGVGKCNSNGLRLLEVCSSYGLLITNTIFRLPNRNKTSWMHPRSKHWHLIDYINVRKKDRQDVRITKAMCGAECWTDHRLIISKMNIRIKPKRRPQGCMTKKRINVAKLKNHQTNAALSTDLESQIANFNPGGNVEEDWESFRDTVHSTAVQVLGYPSRHQHDWFDENDEEIQALLDEKHRLHRAYQDDPTSVYKNAFASARRTVQSLNTIYGPRSSGNSPLLSSDGTSLITEKEKIMHRWAEHFEAVLNRPSSINDEAIDRLPQVNINTTMDVPPVESEVRRQ
ncbi:uncharacterized protein LOC124440399 [Xenia sp. Carnegie-2017]|uniref:uncharacterized protein LOC124440399 n=1 Tax=Xenia sp. Carnegie-2017 TaxID=2897299 RepID=UPI001F034D09|nr:uncharacterized protein LOC124440399 [Xenia sp. Carnegie-2017]